MQPQTSGNVFLTQLVYEVVEDLNNSVTEENIAQIGAKKLFDEHFRITWAFFVDPECGDPDNIDVPDSIIQQVDEIYKNTVSVTYVFTDPDSND
jgi:hypothetical protein